MIKTGTVSRKGFTLIEMLSTLAVTATVLTLGGLCFAEVVRLRGAQDRYRQRVKAADFFLRAVERDVRASKGFSATCDAETLTLITDQASTIYKCEPGRVWRTGPDGRRDVFVSAKRLVFRFDYDHDAVRDARSVTATTEWDEDPRIGISHPMLSLRTALRPAGR